MKIKIVVEKRIDVNLLIHANEEYILNRWHENTMDDEDFLNKGMFKKFCASTIGGEYYEAASKHLDALNNKIKELKKEGYNIDYDFAIDLHS